MEDRYLTVNDVQNIADTNFNVVKFGDLKKYKSLDDLFEVDTMGMKYHPVDNVLILYEMQPNSGHWCTLKRLMGNTDHPAYSYHFLDPYGEIIDSQRNHVPPDFRIKSGQSTPLILQKLFNQMIGEGKTGVLDIHYNDKVLQGPKTSTCGRYAGLFMKYDTTVENFAKQLKSLAKKKKMSVDDLVIKLTASMIA